MLKSRYGSKSNLASSRASFGSTRGASQFLKPNAQANNGLLVPGNDASARNSIEMTPIKKVSDTLHSKWSCLLAQSDVTIIIVQKVN